MSRTYRILIVGVVAVLAVGGYWKFAVAPQREQAAALDQKVIAAEAQLAQTQSLIATYKDAKAQYNTNYATVVRLGKAVPADDDTRSLVVQLDTAAKRSGIDFDSIDITAAGGAPASTGSTATLAPGAVNVGSFAAMPFNFAFTGRFDNLVELPRPARALREGPGREHLGQRPPAARRWHLAPAGRGGLAGPPGRGRRQLLHRPRRARPRRPMRLPRRRRPRRRPRSPPATTTTPPTTTSSAGSELR